jgi:hypothetical protein
MYNFRLCWYWVQNKYLTLSRCNKQNISLNIMAHCFKTTRLNNFLTI